MFWEITLEERRSFIGHGLIKAEWSSETSKFSSCLSTQGTAWKLSKVQEFAQSHTALCWEGQTYHPGCLIPCVVSFPALWRYFSGKRSSVPRHAVTQWRLSSELQPFDFMHVFVVNIDWAGWQVICWPQWPRLAFLACVVGMARHKEWTTVALCVICCVWENVWLCVRVFSSSANSIFNLQVLKFHFDIFDGSSTSCSFFFFFLELLKSLGEAVCLSLVWEYSYYFKNHLTPSNCLYFLTLH